MCKSVLSDKHIKDYIESGILELYVLGITGAKENEEVEQMLSSYSAICKEVILIGKAMNLYAHSQLISPDPAVKSSLMAQIEAKESSDDG